MPADRNPSDEVLVTVFAAAEYLINSRPYLIESDNENYPVGPYTK